MNGRTGRPADRKRSTSSISPPARRRLSLARALVRRPRLLILDDATSAVDPEVEARILASLRDDRSEGSGDGASGSAASLVVVAYRKATISLADEVVHLDEGRIFGARGPGGPGFRGGPPPGDEDGPGGHWD